jgi:uncharacterized RDD family membrane protein YckC
MNESIDDLGMSNNPANTEYGTFWLRFGAHLIDLLAVAAFVFLIGFILVMASPEINVNYLALFAAIIGLFYKPFMEYKYQATLGKMALQLKVVNYNFEKPGFGEIFLRNIFIIANHLSSLFITMLMLYRGETPPKKLFDFENQREMTQTEQLQMIAGVIFLVLIIIDIIVLLSDERSRSLHDKIGKTYVIKK